MFKEKGTERERRYICTIIRWEYCSSLLCRYYKIIKKNILKNIKCKMYPSSSDAANSHTLGLKHVSFLNLVPSQKSLFVH